MSQLDALIIAKHKLYQIVVDQHLSKSMPKLVEQCFDAIADLEKEIFTLKNQKISNPDEDTYKQPGDRVQEAILPI